MSVTIFWALIAYFQNNDLTQSMLDKIDGLNYGINAMIGKS